MLSINTNAASLFAQNSLSGAQSSLAASVQRLSSGLRINSAADDAAGLAISQSLQSQLRGINQSIENLSNAINVLQTADSGLSTVQDLMLRMEQLATAGNDASLNDSQKSDLVSELKDLLDEINATATRTQFNGIHLLDNGMSATSSAPVTAPSITKVDGAAGGSSAGTTESAIVTFQNLAAGQTVSLAGRTFTAGNAGASASDVAAAMAQNPTSLSGTSASGASVGTFSGVITGWTTSGLSGASLTYTSTTSHANVSDLTAPTVSVTQGQASSSSTGVTETAAVSFSSLGSGQSVSLAGLTFKANSAITANQVATAFASLSNGATTGGGSGYGTYSGTLNGWTTGVAGGSGVTFTSTTADTNVSDLTATTSGAVGAGGNSTSQILEFQSGANSDSYVSIKTINIRTDSNGSNQVMQFLGSNINTLVNDSKLASNDPGNTKFLDLQSTLSKALDYISKERTTFASQLSQTSFIVGNLNSESVNITRANSAITDADFALETSKLAKGQILSQASTAVLAQANQAPSMLLRLLGDSFSGNYNIQNFVY